MIAIIGAMEIEIAGLMQKLTQAKTHTRGRISASEGTLCTKQVVLCRCGIGKVNAAAATAFLLGQFPSISLVINLGVAGGVKPDIRQGDIVVATSTVQHDYDQTPDGLQIGQVAGFASRNFVCDKAAARRMRRVLSSLGYVSHSGVIASGDQFIRSKTKATELYREFDAFACDMESGAIAHVCALYETPFLAIRSVSDNADGSAVEDFYSFVQKAAQRSICAVEGFLAEE